MSEAAGYGGHMRRILRHSLIYGLGFAGTSALMILLTPLYTHLILPEDYGKLRLVSVTLEVLGIVARLGVIEALYRFFYQFSGEQAKGDILGSCLLTLTLPLLLLGGLMALGAPLLSEWILGTAADAPYFYIAAGTLIASGISSFGLAHLRVEEKSGWYAAATVLQLALALGLNIVLLLVFKLGVTGVLLSSLSTQSLLALVLLPQIFRGLRPRVSAEVVRKVLRFGVPLVPAGVAAYLIANAGLYFLNAGGSLAEVGVFSLALQFGAAINLLVVTPFDMTWAPMKFKLVNDPNAQRVYSNILSYYVAVVLFALLGLAGLIGDLMALIINARYQNAALYVGAIGLGYAIFGAYRVICFGVDIRNKTHYRALIIIAALGVSLAVNSLCVPRMGAWGAILALLAAYLFMFAVTYRVSQRLFPIRYQPWRIVKALLAALALFALIEQIDTANAPANLALKSLLVVCYPPLLYLLRFFDDTERAALRRLLAAAGRRPGGPTP